MPSRHHSQTLPSMSYRPQGFGFFLATGWVPDFGLGYCISSQIGGVVPVGQLEIYAAVAAVPGNGAERRGVSHAEDLDPARVEGGLGPRTAGMLPLGLGRQHQIEAGDAGR